MKVPLIFRKRGRRKLVVTPDGAAWAPRPRVDSAMVAAVARAFRWRKRLATDVHATLEDLARAKGVNATFKLNGTNQLPRVIQGVKFTDGVAQCDATQNSAA